MIIAFLMQCKSLTARIMMTECDDLVLNRINI